MKRLIYLCALSLAILGSGLPARAVVINNGIVVVTNHTTDNVVIYLENALFTGHFIESNISIAPGHTWRSSVCCFAAGTQYQLLVSRKSITNLGGNLHHGFTPHLCNHHGIPYGFYEVVLGNQNHFYEGDRSACYQS